MSVRNFVVQATAAEQMARKHMHDLARRGWRRIAAGTLVLGDQTISVEPSWLAELVPHINDKEEQ